MPDPKRRHERPQQPPDRPYRENKKDPSKKERAENEFIAALEMIIGGRFTELQKDYIRMLRADLLAGRPFAQNSMRGL